MKAMAFTLFLLAAQNSFADVKMLEEFYTEFKAGHYQKAIDSLEHLNSTQTPDATKFYLSGISYARLQEYDKAKDMLKKAIDAKSDAQDIYYEYGQALYANNNLKLARVAFQKSADINYNTVASLYYVAHISQILEEYNLARKTYLEVLKNKDIDSKMEQIAKFQLAETGLSILRELNLKNTNNEKMINDVDKKVIPLLKSALELDKASSVSFDIDRRIKEIQKEFNLDPDLMVNGRRISAKRYTSYVDIKSKFDDNVTNTNLENDVQQSHKESFYVETEADFKYDYAFKKKFIISPQVRFNYNQYANQDEGDVFQNDAYYYTFTLGNKYEHTAFKNPASFIFNLDYVKNFKDYEKTHNKKYYSKAETLTLGEMFSYFSQGDTTFKFKFKDFSAYSDSLNNHTITISVDQTLALPNNQLLIGLLEADLVNNYNNDSSSTNAYMLRFDYIIPEITPTYSLTISFTTTLTDTLKLSSTRGFETTLNPALELSKDVTEKLKATLGIDYTKNKSKSADYTYQKYVTNFELKYSF